MKTQELKTRWIDIAKSHQDSDRFIQGSWLAEKIGDNYKGCMFGCMTQSEDNTLQKASEEMELPLWVVSVAEKIFEGLSSNEAVLFPLQFIESIKLNQDWDKVYKKWNYTVLMDQLRFCGDNKQCYDAVKQCADLFLLEEINESAESAAESARSAAWSAAESAWSAWSAAESAAWSAWSAARSARSAAWSAAESARSAAWSAAESARSAAWSAARSARSAAWSAAWSAYYVFLRDTLLKLISE